jgi:endo-1,4-beta-xylanase
MLHAEPQALPLCKLADAKGMLFGFAVNDHTLQNNEVYCNLIAREAAIVTLENALKWEAVAPEFGAWDFSRADGIAKFADIHHLKMRGHTLCWHRALPAWFQAKVTADNAEKVLRDHIANVIGHYRGKMHSWDVVNEAIQPNDKLPNNLRNSPWYQLLGPRYIDIAFRSAHEADPHALLVYNDWGCEYANHSDDLHRASVLSLVRGLQDRKVPIHAVGLQSHLRAGTHENFDHAVYDFMLALHSMGIQIFLTELDVDDSKLTTEGSARDAAVAEVYSSYLDTVLSTGAVSVIQTWGAWDPEPTSKSTSDSGHHFERPLLFDRSGIGTEQHDAVAKALSHAKPYARLQPIASL